MKLESLDTENRVIIIAEIGNNHEGSYTLAEEMIGQAAEAGADAVKFQTIIPEKLVSIKQQERIKQLKRYQLSYDEFAKLAGVAKKEGVIFLSTPFDIDSAIFLNDLVPGFKIASSDNNFFPLIDVISRTGKPIIMSTGLMNLDEIKKSALFIKNIWHENKVKQDLALLHCVTSYPTPLENASLSKIRELDKIAEVVGYSDHTLGIEAAVLSVAIGARVIEKHFTIDNHYSGFHDHQLSANPDDFKELVRRVRTAEIMLGRPGNLVFDTEQEAKQNARRSIVANRNLPAGHILKLEDLNWVRPGGGIRTGDEEKIIGRKLNCALKIGEKIDLKSLE